MACAQHDIDTIEKLLNLQKNDPEQFQERSICNYHLGEIFLLDLYKLVGRDAMGASMRELYLEASASQWTEPITEKQIHSIFLANVPAGKADDFDALYARYHGGTYAES